MNRSLIVVLCLVLLSGCHWFGNKNARPKPDVEAIKKPVASDRFDLDLFALQNQAFDGWRQNMIERYGEFYLFYIDNFIIGPRPAGDTSDIEEAAIRQYISDRYVRTIEDSIIHAFPDTKKTDEALSQAFAYFKYYIPEFEQPRIIYFNSAYSAGASPFGRRDLVIGLDMFLGDKNKDYDSVGVFQYLRHKMKPEYIPRFAVESVISASFSYYNGQQQKLLDAIVDRGRQLYFLSHLFPEAPDSLLLGFTQKQTDFCTGSEKEIWKFLNDKDVLLKSNSMDQARYLGEGPTTTGMPADAPGNIGSFVGLQIVRSFSKETGNAVSLKDLMTKYTAEQIFAKAKYRP